ncbi:unnamed protein product [Vitrella brassicaformis CCMP3155]|uniref:Uncharacterized protein n=1 Tax=Vitrella brassicaformis (strain CCMP3155) TaxID=1169540 RepID=A0A0G4F1W9_VITBC|nr:unnamed protein product [Vitrella brassicaformis CCMP3155]|eukprot:CEM05616.1 unnamed protein product [Vitrella brassicaformis CCMP3155]
MAAIKADSCALNLSFGGDSGTFDKLHLMGSRLDANIIFSLVISSPNLMELDLRGNQLSPGFGWELMKALGRRYVLLTKVNGVHVRPLKDNTATSLNLSNWRGHSGLYGIEVVGAIILSHFLRFNESLKQIVFRRNDVQKEGAKAIAQSLIGNASSPLESVNTMKIDFRRFRSGHANSLNLANRLLVDEDIIFLEEWLLRFDCVKELDLSNSSFGHEGIKKIARYVLHSGAIESLTLDNIPVDLQGLAMLTKGVRGNRSLRRLSFPIACAAIGHPTWDKVQGLNALAEALLLHPKLEAWGSLPTRVEDFRKPCGGKEFDVDTSDEAKHFGASSLQSWSSSPRASTTDLVLQLKMLTLGSMRELRSLRFGQVSTSADGFVDVVPYPPFVSAHLFFSVKRLLEKDSAELREVSLALPPGTDGIDELMALFAEPSRKTRVQTLTIQGYSSTLCKLSGGLGARLRTERESRDAEVEQAEARFSCLWKVCRPTHRGSLETFNDMQLGSYDDEDLRLLLRLESTRGVVHSIDGEDAIESLTLRLRGNADSEGVFRALVAHKRPLRVCLYFIDKRVTVVTDQCQRLAALVSSLSEGSFPHQLSIRSTHVCVSLLRCLANPSLQITELPIDGARMNTNSVCSLLTYLSSGAGTHLRRLSVQESVMPVRRKRLPFSDETARMINLLKATLMTLPRFEEVAAGGRSLTKEQLSSMSPEDFEEVMSGTVVEGPAGTYRTIYTPALHVPVCEAPRNFPFPQLDRPLALPLTESLISLSLAMQGLRKMCESMHPDDEENEDHDAAIERVPSFFRRVLRSLLMSPSLRKLDLRGNYLTESDGLYLLHLLQNENTNVETLNCIPLAILQLLHFNGADDGAIDFGDFDDPAGVAYARAAINTGGEGPEATREVRLDEGDALLLGSLVTPANFPLLVSLRLSRHTIPDNSLVFLADIVVGNQTIKHLQFGPGFKTSAKGSSMLASAAAGRTNLTSFNGIQLQKQDQPEDSDVLWNDTTLALLGRLCEKTPEVFEHLRLETAFLRCSRSSSDEGMQGLCSLLESKWPREAPGFRRLAAVTHLDLSQNTITDAAISRLANILSPPYKMDRAEMPLPSLRYFDARSCLSLGVCSALEMVKILQSRFGTLTFFNGIDLESLQKAGQLGAAVVIQIQMSPWSNITQCDAILFGHVLHLYPYAAVLHVILSFGRTTRDTSDPSLPPLDDTPIAPCTDYRFSGSAVALPPDRNQRVFRPFPEPFDMNDASLRQPFENIKLLFSACPAVIEKRLSIGPALETTQDIPSVVPSFKTEISGNDGFAAEASEGVSPNGDKLLKELRTRLQIWRGLAREEPGELAGVETELISRGLLKEKRWKARSQRRQQALLHGAGDLLQQRLADRLSYGGAQCLGAQVRKGIHDSEKVDFPEGSAFLPVLQEVVGLASSFSLFSLFLGARLEAHLFGKGMVFSSLSHLTLDGCSVSDRGAFLLCSALERTRCWLETITLRDNQIGSRGCVEVASAVVSSLRKLTALDLAKNQITAEGSLALAAAVAGIPTKAASLSETERGGAGLLCGVNRTLHVPIAEGHTTSVRRFNSSSEMRSPPALRYLDLSWNQIGEIGASIWADVVKTHPTLQYLSLAANDVGDSQGEIIALLKSAVAESSNVSILDMSLNGSCYSVREGLDRMFDAAFLQDGVFVKVA